jgi:hypothetical protein
MININERTDTSPILNDLFCHDQRSVNIHNLAVSWKKSPDLEGNGQSSREGDSQYSGIDTFTSAIA